MLLFAVPRRIHDPQPALWQALPADYTPAIKLGRRQCSDRVMMVMLSLGGLTGKVFLICIHLDALPFVR